MTQPTAPKPPTDHCLECRAIIPKGARLCDSCQIQRDFEELSRGNHRAERR
jgi:predicted nucleic acid-binding Zn ribbon protein